MSRVITTVLALSCLAAALAAQPARVFRARTDVVTVSASVKRGNSPVGNLTAADFRLSDNGVVQKIDAVTIESVPLDVTLFMDTSGSTSGALDRMKRNVRSMAAMLRPEDRVRLLTIGISVYEPLSWQPGGRAVSLEMAAVPGVSVIYDALVAAFAHEPDSGRRHLIVALTDGLDCGSVVDGPRMLDVATRSEAVLHFIHVGNSGDLGPFAITAYCTPSEAEHTNFVKQAAEQSGGGMHKSRFGDPAVRTFARVLSEFRQSYVLRYSPAGVKSAGWHQIRVEVPDRKNLTIRARSGYFGR